MTCPPRRPLAPVQQYMTGAALVGVWYSAATNDLLSAVAYVVAAILLSHPLPPKE